MKKIVGIKGLAHAGKDTIADHLVAEHGFVKMSFADPMREIMAEINPVVGHKYPKGEATPIRWNHALEKIGYERMKVEFPLSREYLQKLGTEAMKPIFGDDVWVDVLEKRALESKAEGVVLADVRFLVEADWINHNDGVIIEVIRPGAGLEGDAGAHQSETESAQIFADITLHNSKTIESLTTRVDQHLRDQWTWKENQ